MSQFAVKWSEIILQNETKLLAYLNNILRCPYLAEDVLQDTFIRLSAMNSQRNFEIKNMTSFTYQVARNIAIDVLRKKKRDATIDIECVQQEQLHDEYSDIETSLMQSQLSDNLNKTVKKLSVRHQNIMSFYRNGRLKQKEIASVYKLSPTLINFMIKEVVHCCQIELAEQA